MYDIWLIGGADMFEGLPKINKKMFMTVNKGAEDLDFLHQRIDAICELTNFKTNQKILEEIFKFTNYEVNVNNYVALLLSRTLLIEEAADTGCRYLHVYFRGEHLMNIRVTSELLCPRGTSKDKVGYQYVTKIHVEK